jgi:hypothetical protein
MAHGEYARTGVEYARTCDSVILGPGLQQGRNFVEMESVVFLGFQKIPIFTRIYVSASFW